MQALSHFSYHQSGRQYLFCDLQGGHYEDCYVLTDPVIMSLQVSLDEASQPSSVCSNPLHSRENLSLTLGTDKSEVDRKQKLASILAKNASLGRR